MSDSVPGVFEVFTFMIKRSNLASVALVAVGAVLGWAAATSQFRLSPAVIASVEADQPTAQADTISEASCCSEGINAAGIAVLTAHNQQVSANAQKSGRKPNILIIWGDDIGVHNISAYSHGIMGYQTPNIDVNAGPRHFGSGSPRWEMRDDSIVQFF
jgi:hypothetical protein